MTARLRPNAPVALCVALALALAGSGCGSDGKDGSSGKDGGSGEAKAVLKDAFKRQVDSGDLRLDLKADVQGVKSLDGPLKLSLEGPFKSNGKKKLPSLDWDISFDGAGQKLSGGVIVTADNAFVRFQGQSYELGKELFAQMARSVRKSQPDRPLSPGALGLDPASWLKDPEVEAGDSIGGDATRKVTGSVDVRKVVEDVVDLVKSPTVRKQLERSGQDAPDVPAPTKKDLKEIEDAIEKLDVEINVDSKNDLRRFSADISFKLPGKGDGDDVKGKLSLAYVLRKVDSNPVIRAPSSARPFSKLLGGFGLGGLGGGLGLPRN